MKWQTKDGFEIEPKDMSDSHLINTIQFILRNMGSIQASAEQGLVNCYTFFSNGEEAQRELDNALSDFYNDSPIDFIEENTPFMEMIELAEKRGLIEPWTDYSLGIIVKKKSAIEDFDDEPPIISKD